MLSLLLCFGAAPRKDKQEIKVFSKLSNNFLGRIRRPRFANAYSVLRDLQDQAARLLVHANRPARYLALFVGSERLTSPSFPFVKQLDSKEDQQVFANLVGAGRIDVFWDEDFTYAKDALRKMDLIVEFVKGKLAIKSVSTNLQLNGDVLPPELEVFGLQEAVTKIQLFCNAKQLGGVELFPSLRHLAHPYFDGAVNQVDFTELAKSKTLRKLNINLNGMLEKQVGLMTNLSVLSLLAKQPTNLPTELGLLTKLTDLTLYDHFEGTFPPEVGDIKGLCSLVVSRTNITSLPPELCNLAALVKMELDRNELMKGTLAQNFSKLKSLRLLGLYKTPMVDTPNMDGWEEFAPNVWKR
jgi:hypothetical protein